MFTLPTFLPNESWCTSLFRQVQWNDCVICPRCQSYDIKNYNNTFYKKLTNKKKAKLIFFAISYSGCADSVELFLFSVFVCSPSIT